MLFLCRFMLFSAIFCAENDGFGQVRFATYNGNKKLFSIVHMKVRFDTVSILFYAVFVRFDTVLCRFRAVLYCFHTVLCCLYAVFILTKSSRSSTWRWCLTSAVRPHITFKWYFYVEVNDSSTENEGSFLEKCWFWGDQASPRKHCSWTQSISSSGARGR